MDQTWTRNQAIFSESPIASILHHPAGGSSWHAASQQKDARNCTCIAPTQRDCGCIWRGFSCKNSQASPVPAWIFDSGHKAPLSEPKEKGAAQKMGTRLWQTVFSLRLGKVYETNCTIARFHFWADLDMYSTVNEIMLKHSKTFRVLVSLRVSPQSISIAPGLNQVKAIMEVMNLFRWFPQGFIARCPGNDHHGRIHGQSQIIFLGDNPLRPITVYGQ